MKKNSFFNLSRKEKFSLKKECVFCINQFNQQKQQKTTKNNTHKIFI